MLKRNSKQILKRIASQGAERNAKRAYMEVHPNASPTTAESNVSQLLKKPEAQIYLQEHIKEAGETVVDVMRNARTRKESAQFQRLAKESAESIQDRELGKATQKTENTNTVVTLNLSLSDLTNNKA